MIGASGCSEVSLGSFAFVTAEVSDCACAHLLLSFFSHELSMSSFTGVATVPVWRRESSASSLQLVAIARSARCLMVVSSVEFDFFCRTHGLFSLQVRRWTTAVLLSR
eukprot:5000743-Prymnesium_polylepis.2